MGEKRVLKVALDEFGWSQLADEAEHQGTSSEDLAAFAIMYYLADASSGRVARRFPRRPEAPEEAGRRTGSAVPERPAGTPPHR
jgi:hypothetical protein